MPKAGRSARPENISRAISRVSPMTLPGGRRRRKRNVRASHRPISSTGIGRRSVRLRQNPFEIGKELLPSDLGTPVGLLLIRPEARLLHAQVSARARWGESPRDDALKAIGYPRVRQRLIWLDDMDLTVDNDVHVRFGSSLKIEAMAYNWLEVVLHQPLLDQVWLCERAPDLFRRKCELAFDDDGSRFSRRRVHGCITFSVAPMQTCYDQRAS